MTNLQIIKELQSRFFRSFYKLDNDKVIELDLSCSSFKIADADLKLIGELTNLQKLKLNSNRITEIQGLDKLTKLKKLDLRYNHITKIQGLSKLTELQTL